MDLDDFWSKLGFVLMTIDGMEHQSAAAALVAFLERYGDAWPDIVASMRESAHRRALFERSLRVLAEKDSHDGPLKRRWPNQVRPRGPRLQAAAIDPSVPADRPIGSR